MIEILLLIILVIFLGMNMGVSGIAPSFAVSYCTNIIKEKSTMILFGIFVVLGAVLLGHNVAKTLGGGILPKQYIDINITLIILFCTSLGLFAANLLKIPQSTSWATVFSIVGVGLAIGHLESKKIFSIIPFWILLPIISYFLTLFVHKRIYPPALKNLWLYEKILSNERTVKKLSIIASCYVAFSIGANNVANIVGPLVSSGAIKNTTFGLFIVSITFIVGAIFWGKHTMCTVGENIIPFGVISATIVGFITATLLICASIMGIPQSLVQLNAASVFEI